MDSILDLTELFDFCDKLAVAPKEAEKFKKNSMQKLGSALARKTKAKGRASITSRTGTYLSRIKRGKFVKEGDDVRIRVYSNAPHAHLIEDGHKKVVWGHRTGGRVSGRKVFVSAAQGFENEFAEEVAKIPEKILSKL